MSFLHNTGKSKNKNDFSLAIVRKLHSYSCFVLHTGIFVTKATLLFLRRGCIIIIIIIIFAHPHKNQRAKKKRKKKD
jgi:hypothetical protein